MSLEHAILGFLQYKPMSGYDLKKIFDTSIQHFWSADQSQIYRTLGRLCKRDLIEQELITQADRPDRKVYHITEDGQAELTAWLSAPVPHDPQRVAALIQVFFAAQLDDDQVLAIFEQQAALLRVHLAQLEAIPSEAIHYADEVDSARDVYFWRTTLELGILSARTTLSWIERVITDLRSGNVPARGEHFAGLDSFRPKSDA